MTATGAALELHKRQDASTAGARHARLRLTNERLRIADELSAVITSSIRTIAEHADVGSQQIGTNPDGAREALQVMSKISRDALNDLRRLLKHMRTVSDPLTYTPTAGSEVPVEAAVVGAVR